jgi:hypothetical protein
MGVVSLHIPIFPVRRLHGLLLNYGTIGTGSRRLIGSDNNGYGCKDGSGKRHGRRGSPMKASPLGAILFTLLACVLVDKDSPISHRLQSSVVSFLISR